MFLPRKRNVVLQITNRFGANKVVVSFARQGKDIDIFQKSNTFEKIFFMVSKYDLEFLYNLLAAALVCWLLLITSCKSTESCTMRERKKATKHWVKGYTQCPDEYASQSLKTFPFVPTKETEYIYKEGKTIHDTSYITDVVRDTVYRTRVVTQNRIDTIFKNVLIKERDLRVETKLQSEVLKYKETAEISKKIAKNWRLSTFILGGILLSLGLLVILKRKNDSNRKD